MCSMHYKRVWKHGDPEYIQPSSWPERWLDRPTYSGAHMRVRRVRGAASAHQCVDCESQARHWSYDHADPDELRQEIHKGCVAAYSADPTRYVPRCVPCHKRFDLQAPAAGPTPATESANVTEEAAA